MRAPLFCLESTWRKIIPIQARGCATDTAEISTNLMLLLELLIEETQKRVFTEDSMGILLGQISKMASESRVDVLASKPLTEKTVFVAPYNLKYQPSGYEFTMQGGYHDLAGLASRIETHGKLLRIPSFEIVPAEKTPDRHVAELKLWAILKAPPQVALPAKKAGKAKNAKK